MAAFQGFHLDTPFCVDIGLCAPPKWKTSKIAGQSCWHPSCAYLSHERQGSGCGIDAVHPHAVEAGIRHIDELSRRVNGDRGERQSRNQLVLWTLAPRFCH